MTIINSPYFHENTLVMRIFRSILLVALSLSVLSAAAQNSKKIKIKAKQAEPSEKTEEPAPEPKGYSDPNGIDPGLSNPSAAPQPDVFTYVEQMPEPGFDINRYLADHLRYPR